LQRGSTSLQAFQLVSTSASQLRRIMYLCVSL
jgi:hypothetical protein